MLETDGILSVYIRTTIDHSFSGKMMGNRRNSGKRDNDYDHMLERNPCKGISSRIEVNSWPYTSWNNIIPMLKNTFSLSSEGDSVEINWSQVDSDTSVYALPIHNAMWFVTMKKRTTTIGGTDEMTKIVLGRNSNFSQIFQLPFG